MSSRTRIFLILYIIRTVTAAGGHQVTSPPASFGPVFAAPVGNQTAAIGREAVFTCSIRNIEKYKVGWLRTSDRTILSVHARTVTHNTRISVTYETGGGNSGSFGANQTSEETNIGTWRLHIRHLKESDRDCYMCQINTSPMRSEEGCLDILVPPDIVYGGETSADLAVSEGDNATLTCSATGHPAPRVSWRREDGESILTRSSSSTSSGVSSLTRHDTFNGTSLQFHRVERKQMGAYLCIASNDVPPAVSKRVTLAVNFAPAVKVPNQLLGAPLGTDVQLECYVEAFPNTINYWLKHRGEMLLDGPKYSIREERSGYRVLMWLLIRRFTQEDVGTYNCVSTNSLGKAEGTLRLYEIKIFGVDNGGRGNDHISIHGEQGLPAAFPRWQKSYIWLSLNSTGEAICSICTEAHQKKYPLSTDRNCMISLQAFVKAGFSCWKNAVERFKTHEGSELRRSTIQALASSKTTSVVEHLSTQKKQEMIDARTALRKIFSTINLLGRQGLALRGDSIDENSNLVQISKARAEDVSELDSWLKRSKSTWLHHDVVNEILERMADKILRQKLAQIKAIRYFSLIMDETSDISRFEQVSICIRIVLDDLTIQEIFIGFYKTENTKSETLFTIMQDVFVRYGLSISNLRGQCFDGASNMSGKITGLQSRILEKEPRALFVHCSAHTLNLVVQDALKDVACARNFIGLVKDIINFIRDSPKRLAQFKNLQSPAGSNLTPYCPTRWCMRVKSLRTLRINENYLAALEFFELRKSDREIDSSTSAKAAGFLKCMESFEFFLLLNVMIDIFERIEVSNAELQKHDLCINESHDKVKTVTNSLRVMRDSRFEPMWNQIIKNATELGVGEPELQRPRKRARRYETSSSSAAHTFDDPKDYYRKLYFEIVDTVLTSLNDLFKNDTMSFLNMVENYVVGKEVDIEKITNSYNRESRVEECTFDSIRLKLHRDMFLDILADRKVEVHTLKDVVLFLQQLFHHWACVRFYQTYKTNVGRTWFFMYARKIFLCIEAIKELSSRYYAAKTSELHSSASRT